MSLDSIEISTWIKMAEDTANWWRARMIEDKDVSTPELVIFLNDPPATIPLDDICCAYHAEKLIQEKLETFHAKYLIRMSGVTRENSVMSFDGSLLPVESHSGMMISLRTGPDPTPLWATFCEITEDGPQQLEHVTDGEWRWETMP